MKNKSVTDRLSFLAEQFDVFECSNTEETTEKIKILEENNFTPTIITSLNGNVLAILSKKQNEIGRAHV